MLVADGGRIEAHFTPIRHHEGRRRDVLPCLPHVLISHSKAYTPSPPSRPAYSLFAYPSRSIFPVFCSHQTPRYILPSPPFRLPVPLHLPRILLTPNSAVYTPSPPLPTPAVADTPPPPFPPSHTHTHTHTHPHPDNPATQPPPAASAPLLHTHSLRRQVPRRCS